MATLGYRTLIDKAPPSLWDLEEMKKVEMADGTTIDDVIRDVTDALNLVNQDLLSDPVYAGLISVQEKVEVKYPVGVTNGFVELSEYGRPDPGRGKTTGHSLPFNRRGRSTGWTMMGLMEAAREDVDSDVRSVITDAQNDWQQRILRRFFKMEAENVGDTSGASVPLADGGVADSNYVPLDGPDGEQFTSSHDHFLRYDSIANAIGPTVEHMVEHGHEPPFDVIGAHVDASTWSGIEGWKAPTWSDINYFASQTERAAIADIRRYNGYVETDYGLARVKLTTRIPTGIFGAYKSYGPLDARNPLRVRTSSVYGFGYRLLPGQWVNAPELLAVVGFFYGVGVGEDRTNGVCVEIDSSGDYATPTIS